MFPVFRSMELSSYRIPADQTYYSAMIRGIVCVGAGPSEDSEPFAGGISSSPRFWEKGSASLVRRSGEPSNKVVGKRTAKEGLPL